MGSFSPIHWLIVIIVLAGIVWPITIILKRMGFSRWWAALFFVPFGVVVGLWLLAKVSWPASRSE